MGTQTMWRPIAATLFALLACAVAPGALARNILDLDTERQPARLLDWGDYFIDADGKLAAQQVLGQPHDFQPTPLNSAYPLQPNQVLWIKFAVPATPDDQKWYVKLPSPGLDSAILYTQGADRGWNAQGSGDTLPVARWPIPHLYPVLPLTVSAADPTWYMLRIQASEGFFAPIEFISEARLSLEVQRRSLFYGMCFGLLAMGALFALATSLALRDTAYLWFGIWAAMASLALMSAVGIAGLHLWPLNARWNDSAPYVLSVGSLAPLLVFVAQALLLRERSPSVFAAMLVTAGCAAAATLGTYALTGTARLYMCLAIGLAAATAIVGAGWWSRRHGNRFGTRIVLALAPLLVAFPVHALGLLQWPLPGVDDSIIAVAALGLSASATYLLLSLRSQERRDHRRRIAQLAEIDPTTGLVNEAVFAARARSLIAQAERFGHQSVIALVDISNFGDMRREFGRKRCVELLLRLSDRLTSMLRNVDTLARMGDSRYGVLVEGPLASSRARAFAAKVIANCIGPLAGLPQGMLPKPKVAVALVPEHGRDVQEVLATLDRLLNEARQDAVRNIIIAPPAAAGASPRAMVMTPTVPQGPDTVSSAPTVPSAPLSHHSDLDEVDA
ncbi:sensor domain-containing diguanylate cyclase [Ramlibacter albus]|uniref:Diguanylate cyclase n=1 Tax=Ramlibacter albus TaxID=2079448 RepID=A0A923M9D0_9BURK|nr:7TM-DISM domain-containing protein [Ramlibacter albus]MBC5765164.1 diguanylate cyclase [Ramlibacter albus]